MARKCHLKERMLLCCNSSRGQNKSCYWLEMISQCPVRGVTISVVTRDSPARQTGGKCVLGCRLLPSNIVTTGPLELIWRHEILHRTLQSHSLTFLN